MKEPFERIAIDIIGLLPRSREGYQYVLVICDYATLGILKPYLNIVQMLIE